ncbi:Dehydrogenase/reductase SDR member 11 [Saguinus oedipus]|uniref:Dehydrogenase/reductase SDR member 11 n=1 Tax=Saguinus oedipus TaxID=9490 RepID=A0ABQ9VNR6_SAGOE|nr:Dehydrogenase/reductase SDR member 11 [Saguinus oedipus]
MRRVAEGLRVESQTEAGGDAGGSRCGSNAIRSAVAAGKRPGVSSSTPVPGSPSKASGRHGPMAGPGMERWRDRLALVTGASVGIGAAMVRALVQQGLKVVGCARTVGNIKELAAESKSAGYPGTLIPYRCDLSNEEDILSIFSAIRSQHSSTSGWKEMLNVNVLALSICTREAYQSMKERNVDDGHIININSIATKYAVTALTEGQRQELREAQTDIQATCLSPGVVETQFTFRLHNKDPEKAAATYEHMKCFQPEDVTEAVIYVLSNPHTSRSETSR